MKVGKAAQQNVDMQMSLSDLANLSQIIGALAVVGSLIFVGLEIRQNTITSRAATLQSNAAYWQDFFAMIGDPKYGKSYATGAAGKDELTGEEFGQFFFMCRAIFMGCENQHYQFRQGLIDQDAYRGYEATIREQIAALPGVRALWSVVRHTYGHDFQQFFDKQIESVSMHPAYSMQEKWRNALVSQRTADNS